MSITKILLNSFIIICVAIGGLFIIRYFMVDFLSIPYTLGQCTGKSIYSSDGLKGVFDPEDFMNRAKKSGYEVTDVVDTQTPGYRGIYLDRSDLPKSAPIYRVNTNGDGKWTVQATYGKSTCMQSHIKLIRQAKSDLKSLGVEDSFVKATNISYISSIFRF